MSERTIKGTAELRFTRTSAMLDHGFSAVQIALLKGGQAVMVDDEIIRGLNSFPVFVIDDPGVEDIKGEENHGIES